MDAPKMTYYARVVDNISNEEIVAFSNATTHNVWYYGKCDGLDGGESQYVVEFDIWNNEPAFNANTYDEHCLDAKNCKLTVWPDNKLKMVPYVNQTGQKIDNSLFSSLSEPFVYARTLTKGYNLKDNPFIGIKYDNDKTILKDITGNLNPNNPEFKGILQGCGDHVKIETKIILPEHSNIEANRYGFAYAFYYEYSE